jgi:hypothetical protein
MTVALPKTEKVAEWNRFIQDRVQGPLRPVGPLLPETLGSVLIIVPGSSGDVILATTVVRYIKDRNPQCRVSFAVKRSNLPLVALCPGVDEAVEWPKESPINPRSRRLKLAGIPDGLPPEPQRLCINPPDDPDTADRVLHRCFGRHHAAQLLAEVSRQPGKPVRTALRDRKVRNAGWKLIPRSILRLLRNAAYVGRLGGRPAVSEAAEKLVIVSSEANMFPPPTRGLFDPVFSCPGPCRPAERPGPGPRRSGDDPTHLLLPRVPVPAQCGNPVRRLAKRPVRHRGDDACADV